MKRRFDDRHDWTETAEELVALAVLRFNSERWRWARCGIPGEQEIREFVAMLETSAEESNDGHMCASGRLVVDFERGFKPYGVEKAKEIHR